MATTEQKVERLAQIVQPLLGAVGKEQERSIELERRLDLVERILKGNAEACAAKHGDLAPRIIELETQVQRMKYRISAEVTVVPINPCPLSVGDVYLKVGGMPDKCTPLRTIVIIEILPPAFGSDGDHALICYRITSGEIERCKWVALKPLLHHVPRDDGKDKDKDEDLEEKRGSQ